LQACIAGRGCPGVGIGVDGLAAVPLNTCSRVTARGRRLQGVPGGPSGGSSTALLLESSLVLDRLLASGSGPSHACKLPEGAPRRGADGPAGRVATSSVPAQQQINKREDF
jgi:hypothetical protein